MTYFLQQAPSEGGIPTTVTAAIISLLVVFGTQLPGIIKTTRGWVESRTQERRSVMKLNEKQTQQALDQNGQFLEEMRRRDEQLSKRDEQLALNNATMNETQRLMNEMRSQVNEERLAWQEERKAMTQTAEAKEVAMQALARENLELKAEKLALVEEVTRLKDKLKFYETGELDPRRLPSTDPAAAADAPTPPEGQGDAP